MLRRLTLLVIVSLMFNILKGQTFKELGGTGQIANGFMARDAFLLPDDTILTRAKNVDTCQQLAKKNGVVYSYNCDSVKWVTTGVLIEEDPTAIKAQTDIRQTASARFDTSNVLKSIADTLDIAKALRVPRDTVSTDSANIAFKSGEVWVRDAVKWSRVTPQRTIGEGSLSSIITYPNAFTWRPFKRIWKDQTGVWKTDPADLRSFAQPFIDSAQTYYVASAGGANINNGTSQSAPLASISYALNTKKARVIILKEGFYNRNQSISAFTDSTNLPLVIIGIGKVILSTAEATSALTWSVHSGNTYKATRSAVTTVVDMAIIDSLGKYSMLYKALSAQGCVDTAGSYYTDGTIVYVHTTDNRSPDANIQVMLNVPQSMELATAAPYVYVENVEFWGGQLGGLQVNRVNGQSQPTTKAYFKNCTFAYAQVSGSNALSAVNIPEIWIQNCEAFYANSDGFNYHTNDAGYLKMKVVEINCIGHHNGINNTVETQNGSTTHDGIQSVRINGLYGMNRGPNVADVNANTKSLNIGCVAYSSTAVVNNSDFQTQDCDMWIYDGQSHSSKNSIYQQNSTGTGTITATKTYTTGAILGNVIIK